ncbi:MAG: PAS domain S-box protein [Acidobacteria bacterium]|nr:PAS domain S-box protein [Acidobacteriota bacterium]
MPRNSRGSTAHDLVPRGQRRVLQFLARGLSLAEVGAEICSLVDQRSGGGFSCVLLADHAGESLRLLAGPRVPEALASLLSVPGGLRDTEAFGVGAVLAGRPWSSGPPAEDPSWGALGPLAAEAGLLHWAAQPVLGLERQVIGAVALGWLDEDPPAEQAWGLLRSMAELASLVIQHQRKQEALEGSERLARSILEHSPLGIQVFDREGNLVIQNTARLALAGRNAGTPGKEYNVLRDPATQVDGTAELYRAALKGDVVERPDIQVRGQDGAVAGYFHQVLYPVKDEESQVMAVVSMSRDITGQAEVDRALRQEKARFEALVQNASDLIFSLDARGRISYVSPSVRPTLGFAPGELLGTPSIDLVLPQDRPRMAELFEGMLRNPGLSVRMEARVRLKEGGFRWLLIRGSNQLGNPSVRGLVFNCSDVTELKAMSEAVAEREQGLRLVLASTEDASWDWDLRTGLVRHNEGWCRLTGEAPGSGTHPVQAWAARVHPEDMPRVMEAMNAHLSGATEQYRVEYRILRHDGRWLWILERGKVVERGESQEPIRFAGTMGDISDRKQAELALQASEERLRAMVSALPDTFLRLDREGRVLDTGGHADPALSGTGLAPGVLLGDTGLPPELVSRLLHASETALAEGLRRETQISFLTERGDRHFEARVLRSGKDEVLCLLRDITEQHRTEEYLRQNQKMESLGLLAGGIAHDFNNLFQGLVGNLNLAELQVGPESPARPVLQRMEGIIQKAAELTQRLLDYSGRGFFLVKRTNLSQALLDMGDVLRVSVPKNVTLRLDLAPDLPEVEVDMGQLQQVLLNLLANAQEAIGSREGTISLVTRTEFLSQDSLGGFVLEPPKRGLHVILEVRDDGPGMPPDTLAHAFDPFFTTKQPGRGLGLPAAIGILRRHEGGLRARTAPGKGASFSLYFPASQVPEVTTMPALPLLGTILLADDEAVVRQVTGEVLRTLGYEVLEAVDGQDALERFQADPERITLALLDLVMPRMDGYATFLAMRKLRPGLPVVFISGYSQQEVPMPAEVQGQAGFLQKPFQIHKLEELLKEVVARRK